jgi:hypothetical protein
MNLPYYFLQDLNNMAMRVQENPKTPPHGIFHQGMIKVLFKAKLGKLQRTWDKLLIHSRFEKENHSLASQSHENIVNPDQETLSNVESIHHCKEG